MGPWFASRGRITPPATIAGPALARRRALLAAWWLLALWTVGAPVSATAQTYPAKPVTLVVPFSPGASNDIIARYVAVRLGERWKQTVIVENRPGAGASIGTGYVAKSKPDGYTLLLVSSTLTTNAATRTDLPFDAVRDLQAVARVATGQMVIVTGPRTLMATAADVVREAKAKSLFYGTSGVGTSTHFAAALVTDIAGIGMEAVHYKGGTEALSDLTSGRIDLYVGTLATVLPSILAKSATAVAITSRTRARSLPDVPTIAEAGLPGAESDQWWGIFAPKGLSSELTTRLNEDIGAVISAPEAADFLSKQSVAAAPMSVEAFEAEVASELARWKALVAKHHLVAQ